MTSLSIEDIQKLKGNTVLACLGNGLGEADALTLAEWTNEDFDLYKKANPRFAQVVERKKVEYKEMLMTPITQSIKKGDAEMAKWMLERQFQSEFSNKTRKNDAPDAHPIQNIINLIQMGKEGSTLLPKTVAMKEIIASQKETTSITLELPTEDLTGKT